MRLAIVRLTPRTSLRLASLAVSLLVAFNLLLARNGGGGGGPQLVSARRTKCAPARDLEMDTCALRMGFLGDHSFVVPKNVSAVGEFCSSLKENIGCIQTYSRDCLQGFTKQILISVLKRGRQQQNSICGTEASKVDFVRLMSSCLPDDKIIQFHRSMDATVARIEYIGKYVGSENRLPALCCSYQIFFEDVELTLARLCPPASGDGGGGNRASGAPPTASYQEVLKFIQKQITSTAGEFIQLVCDNHRSMDDCRSSPKTRDYMKQLELLTAQAHQGKVKNKNRSLLPPILEILESGSV